ncbi:MAG: TetR/AcrR family transcriptional regulator [Eubacteriales bacterium]
MKIEKPINPTRKPVQSRSIQTKKKILNSALALFCEKGYYKTTTNEIALNAQVSIGSLYSYFKDKDSIFFEVLEKYHEKFVLSKSGILDDLEFFKKDLKSWFRALIGNLIQVHEDTKELNRELNVLSYYNPKVAEILELNRKRTMESTMSFFMSIADELNLHDAEAAITVGFDLISVTVDRIVFGNGEISRDRLINAALDMLHQYFVNRYACLFARHHIYACDCADGGKH